MKPKRKRSKRQEGIPRWECFDPVRTKDTGGSIKYLVNDHVSLGLPSGSTYRDVIEAIARQSQPPIAIESLDEILDMNKFIRGKTVFGFVCDEIDHVAAQHEGMRWWISRRGLNVAVVPWAAARLSMFDEVAGKSYVERSKDGRLSKDLLIAIAKDLDAAGFKLNELQAA